MKINSPETKSNYFKFDILQASLNVGFINLIYQIPIGEKHALNVIKKCAGWKKNEADFL